MLFPLSASALALHPPSHPTLPNPTDFPPDAAVAPGVSKTLLSESVATSLVHSFIFGWDRSVVPGQSLLTVASLLSEALPPITPFSLGAGKSSLL